MNTLRFVLVGHFVLAAILWRSNINFGVKHYSPPLIDTMPVSRNNRMKEDVILAKIFALSEVRAKNRYIDSLTHHKKGVSLLVTARPYAKHPYFWVKVGFNNNIRFETYYNFYINESNLEVNYFDPMNNEILSLQQWRRKAK